MPAQPCVVDGCWEPGIGVGYWQGRPGYMNEAQPRPRYCRGHYLSTCGPEFVTATVLAGGVTDAETGQTVGPGGTVKLDPVAVNVFALTATGVIKVDPPAKPTKTAEKPTTGKG